MKLNDDFLAAHPKSVQHVLAHAKAQCALEPESVAQVGTACVQAVFDCKDVSLSDVLYGLEILKELRCPRSAVRDYLEKATSLFPDAKVLLERGTGLIEGS